MRVHRTAVTFAAALIAAFGALACQPQGGGQGGMEDGGQMAAVDTAAIEASFDSMRSGFEEAMVAGDFEAQAAAYSTDAVYSPPMAPPVRGRDSIRAYLERTTPPVESVSIQPMETWILGPDRAVEFGTSTVAVMPEGADEARESASTYFILLQRTPEGWKITREVLNTNQPPPGGGM